MNYRRLLSSIVFSAAVALHVPVVRMILTRRELGLLSLQRTQDCLLFTGLSLVLLISLWVVRQPRISAPLVLIQAMVIAFAGVPIQTSLLAEGLLLTGLLPAIGVKFPLRQSLVLSTAAILIVLGMAVVGGSLSVKLRSASVWEVSGLFALGVAAGALATLGRMMAEQLEASREESTTLKRAVGKIADANVRYQEYAAHVAEQSSAEQRKRITRELHDIVGLAFTNVIAMMNAVVSKPLQSESELLDLFQWVRDTAQTGLKNTRAVLYELRDMTEPRLSIIELILRITKAFERSTEIRTKVEWGNLPFHLPRECAEATTHLVQEALVNSFRHGGARHVDVHFRVIDSVLHVRITDDGRGGSVTELGIGQSGMAERVEHLGGRLRFRSSPHGYRVEASIPFEGRTS